MHWAVEYVATFPFNSYGDGKNCTLKIAKSHISDLPRPSTFSSYKGSAQ